MTVSCLSQSPSAKPSVSSTPTPSRTERPARTNAAHVSLPSDAIVKQQRTGKRSPQARPPIPRVQTLFGAIAHEVGFEFEFHGSPRFREAGATESAPSPPLGREGYVEEVPKPAARQLQKRAITSGEAHIGPRRFSVNALSQRNFPLWKSAPTGAA